jgi:hypothetical protein
MWLRVLKAIVDCARTITATRMLDKRKSIFSPQKRGEYVPIRFAFSSLKTKFCRKNRLYSTATSLSKAQVSVNTKVSVWEITYVA